MARLFTYLVVDAPDQPQQVILWDTLEITVGRAPDRDVVIAHAEVSRQHAVFRLEGQSYTIADLHTSNGTFVNGARVSSHALRPGDVVELGPGRISFRQATESPKGKNVRFASQLKDFAPLGDSEDGGRTVLGLAGPESGAAFDGADYGDRLPSGEAQFEWGEGDAATGAKATAVVDLDPVLDASLEEVELASFEDDELAALDEKPEPAAPRPAQQAPAPQRAPRPPAPPPRAQAAQARPAAPAAPVRAPAPAAAPPAAREVRPAVPPVRQARPAAPPVREASPAAPVQALAEPAAAADDAPTRASLRLEIEGPRGALKAVVAALLDRDLDLGPLRVRLRRPG